MALEPGADPVQALPIDIAYNKLADWLVDRRKVPADWRKKLATVRARVAAALSALPRSVDPRLLNLTTPDCTGYLEAKHIRDVLLSALPVSRNLFGRPAGAAAEWDAIVSAYEKDSIFLGEAAQILVQNTNYEIPYQKKQIAKLQQQLSDLERKESEMKSTAIQSATKFQQACQELGISGVHVRAELLALSKNLPEIFADVVEGLCSGPVGSALEYYQAFVSHAHAVPGDEPSSVLETLTELRLHPPDVHAAVKPLSFDSKILSDCKTEVQSANVQTTEIDWGVDTEDVESSMPIDIDWNIGSIEILDLDNSVSNVTQLPDYPPEEGADLKQISSVSEDQADNGTKDASVRQADVDTTEIDWGLERGETETNVPVVIDWDIDTLEQFDVGNDSALATDLSGPGQAAMAQDSQQVELPTEIVWEIDVEDDGRGSMPDLIPTLDEKSVVEDSYLEEVIRVEVGKSSWFADPDNRSRLLDDLFELKAFLKQTLQEMESEETSALQNQVQFAALSLVPQHGSNSLAAMASSVAHVVDLITNRKTRDLILISTSIKYLERLEVSLTQKKQNEWKLYKSIEDLGNKRHELCNEQALLWPKQEALLARTQSVKQNVEKVLSAQYNGRIVNIIGEINTLLGQI